MTKRFIESAEDKLKRERDQVVKQLEGARVQVGLAKRFMDAPQEDPYWEHWTDAQRGNLGKLQLEATSLQKKIRELTGTFLDRAIREVLDV